MHCYACSMA
ncbi:hypothetical protein LINPERHAP2_LOCUS6031 [Linum perenne]